MYRDKRILALIPARGGSKGLPRKNILPLLGKPLIAWTIEQALASEFVDEVCVSTDDTEIAEVAAASGAPVPFMRPECLAADATPSIDVIRHALGHYATSGRLFDHLILLEPTSPLREVADIDGCLRKLLAEPRAESIVSVAPLESQHPAFAVDITEDGLLRPFVGEGFRVLRRQDLSDAYFFDGTIYASQTESLLARGTFYHDRTAAWVVPRWRSLEIDEEPDLVCAEALMRWVVSRRDTLDRLLPERRTDDA
jgi:CMP-N,N'-diacetyllegionaminic acid synthase